MTSASSDKKSQSGGKPGRRPVVLGPEQGLAERLRLTREQRDMKPIELVRLAKITRQTLNKYEKGERLPTLHDLRKLCDALQVSPNFLLYGDEREGYVGLGNPLGDYGDVADAEKKRVEFALLLGMLAGALPPADLESLLRIVSALATSSGMTEADIQPFRKFARTAADQFASNEDVLADAAKEAIEPALEEFMSEGSGTRGDDE